MKISGAEAIIKCLEYENVDTIFGYPGAAICPFYDALYHSKIKHILTRHEQGAAHAASGYARASSKTGVCVTTSGPGATNVITGIATAYMDSIPLVAITGQVETGLIGKDVFQEADITGATAPFCKHNYLIKSASDIPRIIKEAFYIASTGRPGPVVIDIPVDMQKEFIEFDYPQTTNIRGYNPVCRIDLSQIKIAAQAINEAKSPVICAGGGIIISEASRELAKLAEKCKIPVTTTLMGKGSIPSDHDLYLGMLGSHGSAAANNAINNADLVLILGARVGNRAMGNTEKIAAKAKIIHIDIDPAEIGKNISTFIPIVGDIKTVLNALIGEVIPGDTNEWCKKATLLVVKYAEKYDKPIEGLIIPEYFLSRLSKIAKDAVYTTEVGQNQIWAANYLSITKPRRFISSGGLGTMGYGLPSAIGAKIADPDSIVICISGDGSFQMSIQELGTIKQSSVGVKIVLFNNSRLGMVRELQKNLYCSRYCNVMLEENPDFLALVKAYGIKGEQISDNSKVDEAINRMLEDDEPYLLECLVDPEESTL